MSEDDSYDEGGDEDGGYDDGFESTANYSPALWDPTETGGLLVAGRQLRTFDSGVTWGALKAAVPAVEALGGRLTLVLPGDTSSTGPSDDEQCGAEIVVGVIVTGVIANMEGPAQVDRAAALRELAATGTRDHATVADALPEPLRVAYLAARDELLLVPIGPLPQASLIRGVAGTKDDTGKPGKFHRGIDMRQESHTEGVWGTSLASGEFTDISAVTLPEPDDERGSYWLIARYD
jgi:hypothetical protein